MARLETLEDRRLLSTTAAEYAEICDAYSEFNLPAVVADTLPAATELNIIEIEAANLSVANLSVANLKSAIAEAGATTQSDLIVVRTTNAASTLEYTAATDELSISINAATYGSVSIVGFGSQPLTLNANQLSRVMSTGGTVNLGNLKITGGKASDSGGGGIYNSGTNANLTVTDCIISDNTASYGGGIYSYGTLTINDSTISRNGAYDGGGIYNSGGRTTITDSTISENRAGFSGGGICNDSTLTITNSTISRNGANAGGGIYNKYGTASVTNSEISENEAAYDGGGIYNGGTLTVTNSTISGNSAYYGGGIYSYGTATLYNTIVSQNYNGDVSGTLSAESSHNLIRWNAGFVEAPVFNTSGVLTNAETLDLRLTGGSPAIEAGSNALAVDANGNALTIDLAGNPRFYDADGDGTATVDMGAYEYQGAFISGPKVLGVTGVQASDLTNRAFIDVFFDQRMNPASLTTQAVAVIAPNGNAVLLQSIESQNPEQTTFRLYFAAATQPVTDGSYTITIQPTACSAAGVLMNQDGVPANGTPNDLYIGTTTIRLADLTVDFADASPVTGTLGGEMLVAWNVQNLSTLTAAYGTWSDRVYLSKDVTLSSNDVLLTTTSAGTGIGVTLDASGRYERSCTISLPTQTEAGASPEWLPGEYYLIVQTGDTASHFETTTANNLATRTITLTEQKLPDLVASGITIPTIGMPGTSVDISWTTTNAGNLTVSNVWRESVYLSTDGTLENALLLRTMLYDGPLAESTSIEHYASIIIPTMGWEGTVYFVVVVDDANAVRESDTTNNTTVSTQTMTIPKILQLQLGNVTVFDEGTNDIRCTLTRSGRTTEPLNVTLTSSDSTELAVPATVTIPAGQMSVSFTIEALTDMRVDGDQRVSFTAAADGFEPSVCEVTVTDVDQATLSIALDRTTAGEGETVPMTISHNLTTEQPVSVRLYANTQGQLTFPTTITIPAGATSTTVDVLVVNDSIPERDVTVTLTARGDGFLSGSTQLIVTDDDEPTLSIQLNTNQVSEGTGTHAVTGTIYRTEAVDSALRVALSSNRTDLVRVPHEVTIPAGASSVDFSITVLENSIRENDPAVTITASGIMENCGCTMTETSTGYAQTMLKIIDNDGPTLSLSMGKTILAENQSIATYLTVALGEVAAEDVVVTFTSGDSASLMVPATVTIPAGQTVSAPIPVSTPEQTIIQGNRWISVSADAAGFNMGLVTVLVTNETLPDLIVRQVTSSTSVFSGDTVDVAYTISNRGTGTATTGWKEEMWLTTGTEITGTSTLLGSWSHANSLSVDESYSETRSVTIPSYAIGDYRLIVKVDSESEVAEILETNNATASETSVHVDAAYTATVQTDVHYADAGTVIPLYGNAIDIRDGSPASEAEVLVYISTEDFVRVVKTITDSMGRFQVDWTPLSNESGTYTLAAVAAGISSDQSVVQDTFHLLRMIPSVSGGSLVCDEGGSVTMTVSLSNRSQMPLTGLSYTLENLPENIDVQVDMAQNFVPANGNTTVQLTLTANDASVLNAAIRAVFTCNETSGVTLPLTVRVAPLTPVLTCTGDITSSLVPGAQRVVELELTNESALDSGEITLSFPYSWMGCVEGSTLPSIAAGDSRQIQILLTPPSDAVIGTIYTGRIIARYANTGVGIPMECRVVSELYGDLVIHAVDEYYYYSEDKPSLSGASVRVTDATTRELVASGVTDESGILHLSALPEGYYTVSITANDHHSYTQTVYLEGGLQETVQQLTRMFASVGASNENDPEYQETELEAYLATNTVTYMWTVTPTTIEDRYEITIDATYQTNVPAPVVVIEPLLVDLSDMLVNGQKMQVNFVVTNYGWVAVNELSFQSKEQDVFTFTPLVDQIDVLAAKSSCIIPVVIERTSDDCTECAFETWFSYHYSLGIHDKQVKTQILVIPPMDCECEPWGDNELPGWLQLPDGGDEDLSLDDEINIPIVPDRSWCDVCQEAKYEALSENVWDEAPYQGVSAVDGLISLVESADEWNAVLRGLTGTTGNTTLLPRVNATNAITDILNICAEEQDAMWGNSTSVDWLQSLEDQMAKRNLFLSQTMEWNEVLLGDSVWLTSDVLEDYYGRFMSVFATTISDGTITPEEQLQLISISRPEVVTQDVVVTLIERWNQTFQYYAQGIRTRAAAEQAGLSTNFIDFEEFSTKVQLASGIETNTVTDGYVNPFAALKSTCDLYRNTLIASASTTEGLCAQIKLQIKQQAVLTRDAFEATLELTNGMPYDLTDVSVDIIVYDKNGKDVTNLFGIYDPTTESFISGADGTLGTLAANTSGVANWILIASTECAKQGSESYYIGGYLRYTRGAVTVTESFTPAQVIVMPQAELTLDYFLERNVVGDDPRTEVTEASEPFNLAVLVQNHGYGTAKQLSIESAQPEIIENEKGLLVDFEITGSKVNGYGTTPSLTVNFGDILPGDTAVGEWQMLASMQGYFVDYNARFEHVNGFNDIQFSLIKETRIHELIHTVNTSMVDGDNKSDFLVNDVADPEDLPDTLYLSDGTVSDVRYVTEGTVTGTLDASNLSVTLTVDMTQGEWNYLRLRDQDLGAGEYELVRIVRADGTEVPMANFWQTDRTWINANPPTLENNLHLLDYNETGSDTCTYTLYYSMVADTTGPEVVRMQTFVNEYLITPVESMIVQFSKAIRSDTLNTSLFTLTCNGGENLITDQTTLTQTSETIYQLGNLSSLTQSDGVYVLTITPTGVADVWGNVSSGTSFSTQWVKSTDAPVITSAEHLPSAYTQQSLEDLIVNFSRGIQADSFDYEDLLLTLDGVDGNLINDTVSVTSLNEDGTSWLISGLDALTGTDGAYTFSLNTSGLQSLDGNSGVGNFGMGWIKDTAGPSMATWGGMTHPMTNIPYSDLFLEFDEPIDITSFGLDDLSFSRNGTQIPFADGVSLEKIADATATTSERWKLSGLDTMNMTDGNYAIGLDLSGVQDYSGNAGSSVAQSTWTISTQAPVLTLDALMIRSCIGYVTVSGTLTGMTDRAVTITGTDVATGKQVCLSTTAASVWSDTVSLTEGYHEILYRVTDQAGNVSETTQTIVVDLLAPQVKEIRISSIHNGDALDAVAITFTEPMDISTWLGNHQITEIVTFTNLTTGVTVSRNVTDYTYNAATQTLTVSLAGIDASILNGNSSVRLTIAAHSLTDLAGNELRGSQTDTVVYTLGSFAGASLIQAAGTSLLAGSYSIPVVADWNSDGIQDLIVGEKSASDAMGRVIVFLNQGTDAAPVYVEGFHAKYFNTTTQQAEMISLPSGVCQGVAPRLIDFNQDGLQDLIAGLADGRILYYQNIGTAESPLFAEAKEITYGPTDGKSVIDVGNRATPEFCDWDGNGTMDLIVGAMDGQIRIYLNSVTTGEADYATMMVLTDGTNPITVPTGRSAPMMVDMNGDGILDLVTGNTEGQILYYPNRGTAKVPSFGIYQYLTSMGVDIDLAGSARSRVFVCDYSGDGILDLLVGSEDGTVRYYAGLPYDPFSNEGESGTAFTWSFRMGTAIQTIPEMPTNVTATATGNTTIYVTWGTVDTATEYVVERSEGNVENWQRIGNTTTKTWTDTGLTPNTTYNYRISAMNAMGLSDVSDVANATTPRTPETAATIVTMADDVVDAYDGLISLREAIAVYSISGDTITFDVSLAGKTITLGGTQIVFTKDLTVQGNDTTIDANHLSRVFQVNTGITVTMTDLTVTGGNADDGAGIKALGTLTLHDVMITNNTATGNGGGLWSSTRSNLYGCIIADNAATGSGGGMWTGGTVGAGVLNTYNCTIALNDSAIGGGIANRGTLTLNNTIVAKNTATDANDVWTRAQARTRSSVYNSLIGDATFTTGKTVLNLGKSLMGTSKVIDPLFVSTVTGAWNLGLQDNSPAINTGNNTLVPQTQQTDYVGNPRIIGTAVDMGAVEYQRVRETISTVVNSTADDIDPYDGEITLREAIEVYAAAGGTITFAASLADQTITLGGTQLEIGQNLTVSGNGVTIDANRQSRTFFIRTGAIVTMSHLTITGGLADHGGGIQTSGTLILDAVTLADNEATENGGALWSSMNTTLVNTVIVGNTAGGSGGGVWTGGSASTGKMVLTHCTVAMNTAAIGGGIANLGTVTFNNTIVAKNTATDANDVWTKNNARLCKSYVYSSLIGDGSYTTGRAPLNSDGNSQIGGRTSASVIDPIFANIGGTDWRQWNLRLSSDSPAIDAGSDMLAVDVTGKSLQTDHDGHARKSGNAVDIGAYEMDEDLLELLARGS